MVKPRNSKFMKYQNFNRHKAFTPEIMTMVRETIKMVDYKAFEIGKSPYDGELMNMLYGLYDGFYYEGLIEAVQEFGFEEGHVIYNNIAGIQNTINMFIKLFGKSETQIH